MLSKKQYILIITLAVLLGILTAIWQIPFWMTAIMIFLSVTLIVYIPFVWYIYFSSDIESIGKYLQERARQPILHFYYSLANSDDVEMDKALLILQKKYKSPQLAAVFTAAHAAHQDTLADARESILLIKDLSVRHYYEALLKIEEGKLEDAGDMIHSLQKEWMKETVKAELHLKKGQVDAAKTHVEKAIELTKGMQKYLLVKRYRSRA
ncbi:hypothetical protein D3H55_22720 [Bacillus salacetis]|uniref:Tetratricopeptide repeat protein n=1 Tax=Bacillus salacetis TaxID=2315464 RepID=A0A3A1QR32_9BACI|nr:hypothetical protein [Bacillus salacetis]RIW27658.1 hypothetical protein D3H55_22720 [Bacillus salacetis]